MADKDKTVNIAGKLKEIPDFFAGEGEARIFQYEEAACQMGREEVSKHPNMSGVPAAQIQSFSNGDRKSYELEDLSEEGKYFNKGKLSSRDYVDSVFDNGTLSKVVDRLEGICEIDPEDIQEFAWHYEASCLDAIQDGVFSLEALGKPNNAGHDMRSAIEQKCSASNMHLF